MLLPRQFMLQCGSNGPDIGPDARNLPDNRSLILHDGKSIAW
jgi:hypothetical protein